MKSLHHALQRSTLNLLVIMLGLFFILGSGDIVITINGDNPVTVVQGSTYIDAGATAKDDDGVLNVITTGLPIDTSIVGTYEITYTATGDDGEKKAIRKVHVVESTVVDIVPPVITILGDNPASIQKDATYTDAGATATDDIDGNVAVSMASTVDTRTAGEYVVTYTASDAAGNVATATRVVSVTVSVTTVTISGKAVDAPIVGGDVVIKDLSGITIGTGVTGTDGGYSIDVNESDIADGYEIVVTGGQMAGEDFTGELRAIYSASDARDLANVTPITTIINIISNDFSGSKLEQRNEVIQKLSSLGMITAEQWHMINSSYFDLASLGSRIKSLGGITNWIQVIKDDIADGELSIEESLVFFPKAHSGIKEIFISLDKGVSLLPGEKTVATFLVSPERDGQLPIIKLIQAPDWVTLSGQEVIIEPPMGTTVGEVSIAIEAGLDEGIIGRKTTIKTSILKQVSLLSGTLDSSGGKIENDWRDISVSAPAGALTQTYTMSYYLGYDDQGTLRLSWKVIPEMPKSEKNTLVVTQPSIDVLISRYADELSVTSQSLQDRRLASRDASTVVSSPSTTSQLDTTCLSQWEKHAADDKGNGDDFQFSHVLQSTVGKFSLDEPGLSTMGELSRPRMMPSKEDKFVSDVQWNCASMLLSETNSTPLDSVPVLLVHGYAGGVMGEIDDYFANFPKLIKNKGYIPYTFNWHTNSRFEDSANELGNAIKKIGETTGKQVHIVAHSFGGLLTRTLLQGLAEKNVNGEMVKNIEFNKEFMEKYISSVITIGTPHSGIFGDNTQSVEFDTPTQDNPPITFYYGRDDFAGAAIEHCSSLPCHEAGEDYYRLGGLGSDLDKLLDFGVADNPGQVVYNLANTFVDTYPDIPTKVLLGFKPDGVSCDNDSLPSLESVKQCDIKYSVEIDSGDGLISLRGQRFLPTLNTPALTKETFNGVFVKEHLLGFTTDNFSVGNSDPLLADIYSAMGDDGFFSDGTFKPGIVLKSGHYSSYSSVIYHHRGGEGNLNRRVQKTANLGQITLTGTYKSPILTEAGLQSCNPNAPDMCQHASWKYLRHMVDTYPSQSIEPLPKINTQGKIVYKDASGAVQDISDPTDIHLYIGSTQVASVQTDSEGIFNLDVDFNSNTAYELRVIPPSSAQSRSVNVQRITADTLEESSLNFSQIELFSSAISFGDLTVQLKDGSTGSTLADYILTIGTLTFPQNLLVDHKQVDVFGDAVISLPQGMYTVKITKTGYIGVGTGLCIATSVGNICDITMVPEGYVVGDGLSAVLTWDVNPRDLDSHLLKYDSTGSLQCHTYYSNRTACGNEGSLDLDDTSSYGPETIAIQQIDTSATYVYAIHHYSGSGSITTSSQAKITVTLSDGSTQIFNAPTTGEGKIWNVFTIKNGTLLPCQQGCISDLYATPLASSRSATSNNSLAPAWQFDLQKGLVPK